MKKIILCGIPMKERVDLSCYTSEDKSLSVANIAVRYPINAFLRENLNDRDVLKVILLVKKDSYGHYKKNAEYFCSEIQEVNAGIGAKIELKVIDTDYEESQAVHEKLMGKIVDELETGSHILADVTYGPKDLPIVIFTALSFAEKFLDCTVDNIVYGQASFVNGKAVDTKICDMVPLYCLGSVTGAIHTADPDKARAMLRTLLSL